MMAVIPFCKMSNIISKILMNSLVVYVWLNLELDLGLCRSIISQHKECDEGLVPIINQMLTVTKQLSL